MTDLSAVFGDSPRVRLIEAILRLGPVEFTAVEAAREAGLHKPSAYTHVRQLEQDGLIEVVSEGRPVRYRLPENQPSIRLLAHFISALELMGDSATDQLTTEDILRLFDESMKDSLLIHVEEHYATSGVARQVEFEGGSGVQLLKRHDYTD